MSVSQFKRTVNLSTVPICEIMGVNIAAINMAWLKNFTNQHISQLSGDYMCVANVHTTVTANQNPDYMAIQNGSVLTIPDGGPLTTVGRRRGFTEMQRTTGPGYMAEIFNESVQYNYRHFFYGSSPQTLEKMRKVLQQRYPGIAIAGMYSPPFRSLTEVEDERVIDLINSARADFVWVGLGAPKQERWMANHQGSVKGFMVGVGAGFDYFAGNIKRAPKWMQENNLEWLYRLLQDPKRLFKRYFVTNLRFLYATRFFSH